MAIAKALETKEREAAKERKAHDGRSGKLPPFNAGKTSDKVASSLCTRKFPLSTQNHGACPVAVALQPDDALYSSWRRVAVNQSPLV